MITTTEERSSSHLKNKEALGITAYCINPEIKMPLVTASQSRQWMNETNKHFANRCLPLLIANQAGWFLLSGHTFTAVWDGGNSLDSVRIEYHSGEPPFPALSHFGHGILTWNVPYLFRTSPGYNLQVRGPANWPKDGICPLEGIVEADWLEATFTVNWKFTRTAQMVMFEVG